MSLAVPDIPAMLPIYLVSGQGGEAERGRDRGETTQLYSRGKLSLGSLCRQAVCWGKGQ